MVTSMNELIKTLSPFLSTDSSIDEQITATLKNIFERFIMGVKYVFAAVGHTYKGLMSLCKMLIHLHKDSQYGLDDLNAISDRLRVTVERLLLAHANAIDGREVYQGLLADVEVLIQQTMDDHDPNVAIRVSGKATIEQRSPQALGSTIKGHMEQVEHTCSYMLRGLVWKYPSLFQAIQDDERAFMNADVQARAPDIIQPKIKELPPPTVVNPNATASMHGAVLTQGATRSGRSELRLLSVTQTKPGISTMKVNVSLHQSGMWYHLLKSFHILCRITTTNADSSLHLSNHFPTTLKEMVADTAFKPRHCKPCFKLVVSSTTVARWHFWKPIYRWTPSSAFPSHFSISFDIEHNTRVGVEFHLVFEYRRRFMPILTDREQMVGKPYFVDPLPLSAGPLSSAGPQDASSVE
ncbi:hypothetical protein CVT24_000061 [Panaeolus cyanescens]|uniref:Uncharacterized protein n=1 Tax=Panaeolus cyanescens TaxID=181874 RepID=A0A409VWG9_9AGAR|nr:hypothetical protein CVT24_000061 [Panaeolus cyanescens]